MFQDKDIEFFKNNPHGFKIDCSFTDNKDIITMDDFERNKLGLPPQTYDAFVLFADSDIDFATELIETMEKHYNLKLCVKDRDLVGGVIEHDAVIELISKRCRRLVVIVSPSFFESPVHKYLFGLAQVEGIGIHILIVHILYFSLDSNTFFRTEKAQNHTLFNKIL